MIKNLPPGAPDGALHLRHREQTGKFSEIMAQQLTQHRHIGNWDSYKPSPDDLEKEMALGLDKLLTAVRTGGNVAEKAADLANFAMKAAQLYQGRKPNG